MTTAPMTDSDTQRAEALWSQYCAQHDLSQRQGQAAGIDPFTGRVWFGESPVEIVRAMRNDGCDALLYFVRVGEDYLVHKGGRRG